MDCSNIRTVRVHKEQFDAIENKADVVIITCIEDGRSISFNREKNEEVTSEEKSPFNKTKCDWIYKAACAADTSCSKECDMECPFV